MSNVLRACAASADGDPRAIELTKNLVDNGLDPKAGDYDGRTPLHLAACSGKVPKSIWTLCTALASLICPFDIVCVCARACVISIQRDIKQIFWSMKKIHKCYISFLAFHAIIMKSFPGISRHYYEVIQLPECMLPLCLLLLCGFSNKHV